MDIINKPLYDAKISGTGSYLPTKRINNLYFEKRLDTSDEWIRTRTGMWERRWVNDKQAASDLAYEASKKALKAAGLKAKDLDLIIVGTISPDHPFPSTACILQKKLGIKNIPAFDLSAGCTGFVYAMTVAAQFVQNGTYEHVLVVGVEILSRITNMSDRNTAILFGDGAGAAIISKAKKEMSSRIMDYHITADGSEYELLIQEAGGSRMPASHESVEKNLHTVYMEGNKIFKLAIQSMRDSCEYILKKNNMTIDDIDYLIPHQANYRIIETLGKKLNIGIDKVVVTIENYANTSSSTIPIALDEAIKSERIKRGKYVLLTAFGAGLTSGSILFRY